MRSRCYQSVKDRKFESNSQHKPLEVFLLHSCYQSVKDRKFESNSQHLDLQGASEGAVISLSKIENLKAIHNREMDIINNYALLSVCQR